MKIQEVIPICRETKHYGRPRSWKGQGRGVDLAQNISSLSIKEVIPFSGSNSVFSIAVWKPTPEELLEPWEVVDSATLHKEKKERNNGPNK